jgi:hypothetical protein
LIHSSKKIVSLGREHPFVEVGSRAEDLGDLAFDKLAGAGFFDLIANGDFAPGFKNAADIGIGGVKRDAAHGNNAAFCEGNIQELSADLGVFEKEFVEITKAEKKQRIFGQFAFDAAILRHHGSQLDFGGHRQNVNE